MSSIHANIAAGAAQSALQQSQVARARDANKRQQELRSQKLKELLNRHLESVEDSTETDAGKLRVRDEESEQQKNRRKRQQQEQHEQTQAFKNIDGQTHIDLKA